MTDRRRFRTTIGIALVLIAGLAVIAICFVWRDTAGGVNIWEAVRADDAAAIATFAKAGGDVNTRKLDGTTPLHVALAEGKRTAYRELLARGADANRLTLVGQAVVNLAAAEPDPYWLRLALERGGDPNLLNVVPGWKYKAAPLSYAIEIGSLENVRTLVEHGANFDAVDEVGSTPLILAAQQDRFSIVMYLLENGVNYEYRMPNRGPYDSFANIMRKKYQYAQKFYSPEMRSEIAPVIQWLETRGVDLTDEWGWMRGDEQSAASQQLNN